jgi:hypothetical protein
VKLLTILQRVDPKTLAVEGLLALAGWQPPFELLCRRFHRRGYENQEPINPPEALPAAEGKT